MSAMDDEPIAELRSLRDTTPPPSLVPAVMRRIAQPAPVTFWSWLRKPRRLDPIAELRSLRETTPPPSLVPAVMRRIAEPAPMTFWSWLRKPRRLELRLSPLNLVGVAGCFALMLVGASSVVGRDRNHFVVQVPAAESTAVVVRFTLVADGARKVAVAGDFNDWDPSATQLVTDGKGNFSGTLRLPPGAHEYMFVVDGQWITDPAASERRPDGFGRTNAVLRL
jgi:hypothetical protein